MNDFIYTLNPEELMLLRNVQCNALTAIRFLQSQIRRDCRFICCGIVVAMSKRMLERIAVSREMALRSWSEIPCDPRVL